MSLRPLYARPRKLADVVATLADIRTGAIVVAGGQEVMPHINYGRLMPAAVIDICAIAELRGVTATADTVTIGALTTHRDLQNDATIGRLTPILAAAAAEVGGGRQVHNRGTVGGNIVAMHPLYDLAPALLALKAEVDVEDTSGPRRTSLAKLIAEASHGLGVRSVLSRIHVTAPGAGGGWGYRKLKATGGAYASANAAAVATMAKGEIMSLSVVIGAATERPIDASAALSRLHGRTWDQRTADEVESICAGLIAAPLADHQGAGPWRRAMAGVMARRAIGDAVARAKAA